MYAVSVQNGDAILEMRSLKRGHSGEDLKPVQQSTCRQRKRFTGQRREAELQCEAVNSGALLNTSGRGSAVFTIVRSYDGKESQGWRAFRSSS